MTNEKKCPCNLVPPRGTHAKSCENYTPQTGDWGERFDEEIHPLINRAIVEYTRFRNTARDQRAIAEDFLATMYTGKSLVSNNKTHELRQKLKDFISQIAQEERAKGKVAVTKKILGRARDEIHLRGLTVDRLLEIVREEAALQTPPNN